MQVIEIIVPDRYEALVNQAGPELSHLVEAAPEAMQHIDAMVRRMRTAGRGAFLILRGDSGSGKSTFLHTLSIFKDDVESISVPRSASIRDFLDKNPPEKKVRIFVLEEREATLAFSDAELETWLHEVNGYLRSSVGVNALVVWPCNTDELLTRVLELAQKIGGQALTGPSKCRVGARTHLPGYRASQMSFRKRNDKPRSLDR